MISILIPTRKRFNYAKESIDSVLNKVNNKDEIEILIALDSDDLITIQLFDEYLLTLNNKNIKYYLFERLGYDKLNIYYNELCTHVNEKSKWLWLWNDDCVMLSKDFDLIVNKYNDKFVLLNPYHADCDAYLKSNHTMFPIIPKKWVDATGRLSDWNHNDTYLEFIANRLNIFTNEFDIVHSHPSERINDEVTSEIVYHKIPMNYDEMMKDVNLLQGLVV